MSCERAEAEVRAACDAGDYDRAVTLVLERYGRELLLFTISRLRSRSDGEEAFAIFATKLWGGLPRFAWRSSVQSWAYTLARNAAVSYRRSNRRARTDEVTLDRHLSTLVDRVRTETAFDRRTENKDRIRALRDRLRPDDRTLLVLRIDRSMDWVEVARVILGDGDQRLDDATLAREAARLRKRFERLKIELRRMAEEEGLIRRS